MKYLGVPLISTRLTALDCKLLVDKIIARIKCWTTQYLSFAGRLQLIKSVLFSLQVYWSGIFILPKKILKRMEQIMKNFLWTGQELSHRGAKVSWKDLSYQTLEGELGIRNLETWNKAIMAKHIWNLCQVDSSSYWVDWVRLHLIMGHSFWEIPIPTNSSWTWRKIL